MLVLRNAQRVCRPRDTRCLRRAHSRHHRRVRMHYVLNLHAARLGATRRLGVARTHVRHDSPGAASARPRVIRQLPASAQHRGNEQLPAPRRAGRCPHPLAVRSRRRGQDNNLFCRRSAPRDRAHARRLRAVAQVVGLAVCRRKLECGRHFVPVVLAYIDQCADSRTWRRWIFRSAERDRRRRWAADATPRMRPRYWRIGALADLGSPLAAAGDGVSAAGADDNDHAGRRCSCARVCAARVAPQSTSRWLQRRFPRRHAQPIRTALYPLLEPLSPSQRAADDNRSFREVLRSSARSRGA